MSIRLLPCCMLTVGILLCHDVSGQADTSLTRVIGEVDVYADRNRGNMAVSQHAGLQDVRLLPAESVADVLRMFNGTNIKDYGGVGGLKTVSVRSLGASHTAVDYDGIPVSNTQAGPVDISRFEVSALSELKLSVGQEDNLLRPAKSYASGAVLSISSLRPTFRDSGRSSTDACIKAGSYGYVFASADYALRVSDSWTVKAGAEYTRADGSYHFELENADSLTTEYRSNTDVCSYKAELNAYYNDSSRNDLDIKAYAYSSDRGLPGSVVYYVKDNYERLKDRNCFLQASWKRRVSPTVTTRLVAKCNYSYNCYTDRNVKYTGGLLEQESTQDELYASWATMWQAYNTLAFGLSIDESYNTLVSDISDRQPVRNTLQAAINARYANRIVSVLVTGSGTHLRESTENGSHLGNLDRWKPTVMVGITPSRGLTLRMMYKDTYRVPTFNELYYTTLGSTNLVPEDAKEFNVGADYGNVTGFSVDLYKNYVDNKIVAIPTTYVWKMANYGKVNITGADVSAHTGFRVSGIAVSIRSGYSYQSALDKTSGKSPKLYDSQIPYTPVHSGNYDMAVEYGKYHLTYTGIWSGRRYFLEYNIPDNEIPRYLEQSVSLMRELKAERLTLYIKVSCINIADKQYDIIKYYPMPGRHYQIQINIKL